MSVQTRRRRRHPPRVLGPTAPAPLLFNQPWLGSESFSASETMKKKENHKIKNIGWLRAAVLGANDGVVSTASLVLGLAAANANHGSVLIAGVAGLVSGSMSMATGEYVSVSSQA